jgi:hypothetical protein
MGDAAQALAAAGAAGGAELNVPDSAPALREVGDAPAGEALRTYDTQLGADALLKQFLSEISDVAREAEVQRRVRGAARAPCGARWCALSRWRHAAQGAVVLQAEPVRAPGPALRLCARRGQAPVPQGARRAARARAATRTCLDTAHRRYR